MFNKIIDDFYKNLVCQAFLSFTISQNLIKLMFIESVMPSNHLILCHPLVFLSPIFLRIRVFSDESVLLIRWPEYWNFSFSISPSNEYSGLISFRTDEFDPLQSMVLSRVFSNATIWKYQSLSTQPYGPALTSVHDYWKTMPLTIWTFVSKVMSLLFNITV